MLLFASVALAQSVEPPRPDAEDPHLWLEEVLDEQALDTVRRWNEATLGELQADPRFEELRQTALDILTSDARLVNGDLHGAHLRHFLRDDTHERGIWRQARWRDVVRGAPSWETLLDLDALADSEGENWVWSRAHCAPRSDRCLVSLSRGGGDAHVVREFSTDSRTFVEGGFELPQAKSSVVWWDEDTVFVGMDTGPNSLTESGYPRQIRRWARGTDVTDAPVVFEGESTDAWTYARVFRDGRDADVVFGRGITFFEDTKSLWRDGTLVPLPLPRRHRVAGRHRDHLLVLLDEEWTHDGQRFPQGALVAVAIDDFAAETVLVPGPGQTLDRVVANRRTVVAQLLDDVAGRAVRLERRRGAWTKHPIDVGEQGVMSLGALSDRGDLLLTYESLAQPATQLHVSRRNQVTQVDALPATFDASDVVVEQRFATSADGTRVPYFLMARQDVLDAGPAPTIQYGYGGFAVSVTPSYFRESARPQHGAFAGPLWVEAGGVLVLSNLRGGGEYGPAWHQAALGPNRQRAFDDFFAIGEALVADGVTTPAQLGALGRSNGGLLMGVALTQRPDLYAAIDCGVPLLDMLRYDKLLAGASWTGEYGDPDVPEERAVLEAYSPYHQLQADTAYPRVLFYTSTRDDRVHPGHARKMAAALEALGVPFLYWENMEGGHGGVANAEQAAFRMALEYLYFRRELGLQ